MGIGKWFAERIRSQQERQSAEAGGTGLNLYAFHEEQLEKRNQSAILRDYYRSIDQIFDRNNRLPAEVTKEQSKKPAKPPAKPPAPEFSEVKGREIQTKKWLDRPADTGKKQYSRPPTIDLTTPDPKAIVESLKLDDRGLPRNYAALEFFQTSAGQARVRAALDSLIHGRYSHHDLTEAISDAIKDEIRYRR